MILGILGVLGMVAGMVLMVFSKIGIGVLIMFAGLILLVAFYVRMMGRSGKDPNQAAHHGLKGEGKQQSEVVEMPQHVVGEQPANIWDQVTGK